MAEVVAVDIAELSSESSSVQESPDFKDPLGVNDHLCGAVDDESDEFDFDVSNVYTSPNLCLSSYSTIRYDTIGTCS